MKKEIKANVIITLLAIALCVGSFIDDKKKILHNISIKKLFICEAVVILMLMYSAFSIIGQNASVKVITIGIIGVILTIVITSLLLNKPKSDWQKDWFFETD